MGIDTSAWRKVIGSFYLTKRNFPRASKMSNGKDIPSSLHIFNDDHFPSSFILLMFILVALFINVIVTAYAFEVPCLTSSLIEHKLVEYSPYENRCGFMPRVESAAEILFFSTSVTLIPHQLLLLAMDINPNPGPTFYFNKDFSSLAPTIKQRFNQYKCTAKKVT